MIHLRLSARWMRWASAAVLSCGLICGTLAGSASAAPSPTVREAQIILTKFGLPTGPIDGYFGPNTGRALCAFRQIAGLPANRATVDSALLATLRAYNSRYANLQAIPAPKLNGNTTYLSVQQTCQTMLYVEAGHFVRVLSVSTGMSGHTTPNGTYMVGYTQRGWSCSTTYPESCKTQTSGRFVGISNYGNMYNKRFFRSGGYYVHGSTAVPTYPASHGCIRVTIADSDWMYDHVGNHGQTYLLVAGRY